MKLPESRTRWVASALLGFAAISMMPRTTRADSDEWIRDVGDVLQIALPVVAGGSTFFVGDGQGSLWDRQGTKQFAQSFGSAWATTYASKFAVSKMRPNGTNRTSYPSGHTMSAFAGASFITRRYGWKVGVPSLALAFFTAYSRVHSQWHFADDTVAGASVALLWNLKWVTPHHSRVTVLPLVTEEGTGFQVSVSGKSVELEVVRPDTGVDFEFAFGPSFLVKNEITAPADGGTTFDLAGFSKRDDPTTTAAVAFTWRYRPNQDVDLFYNPFESRDNGRFAQDVDFGGVTFPADTEIQSAWRLHDLRGRWRYVFGTGQDWMLGLGAGVMFQHTFVRLYTDDETLESSLNDIVALPIGHLAAGYSFTPRWGISLVTEGTYLSTDWMVDSALVGEYRHSAHWTWKLGYQFYDREIETDELRNRVAFNVPYASVRYSW